METFTNMSEHTEAQRAASAARSTAALAVALQALGEAEDSAVATAGSLAEQRDTLARVERNTDEIEHQHRKAEHTLRGMTWWGSVVK